MRAKSSTQVSVEAASAWQAQALVSGFRAHAEQAGELGSSALQFVQCRG